MSAPSFSSFPPVFDSFPDLESSSSTQQPTEGHAHTKHDRNREKKRKDDRENKADKGKERRHEQDKRDRKEKKGHSRSTMPDNLDELDRKSSRRRKRSTSVDEDRERTAKVMAAPESYNRVFFIDRKGDELNVRYGSLYAGDVPKYWHVGRGKKVLGLAPHLGVLYRGSKGVEIGELGWYNKSPQLTDSRARALLKSGRTRRLTTSSKTTHKYNEIDGFIKLPSRKGKEKEQAYRSIAIGSKDGSDSESSSVRSGSEASDSDSDTSPLSAREESLRSLEQRLAKDPTSEQTWLLLLQHSVGGTEPSNKNAEKARAEISVSILERALSAHPSNATSPLLRLKYLKAGEMIWDTARTKAEWDKTLKTITSADILVEWLDWIIRTTPNFNAAVESAMKAIEIASNDKDDYARLRIFWRIATFLRQAGYVERGFALFQAQAELTFNEPEENVTASLEQRLDSLEEFWESEAPRMGEAGAKGWKTWIADKQGDAGRKPRRVDELANHDPYTIWHFGEVESDRRLIFPVRMSNQEDDNTEEDDVEAEDEDPYATILFSDIRPFLIDLRTPKAREIFRLVWLSYLGLHIPGLSGALSSTNLASDDRWADTALLQPWFVQSLLPHSNDLRMITADSVSGVMVGREKRYSKGFDAVKSWSLGVLEPLDGLTVSGEYRMWPRDCLAGLDPDVIDVMRRIIREHKHDSELPGWNLSELAFEASMGQGETALKLSQAMLAENSSSAELLATHAHLERIRHKYDKARKVYRVGLQSLARSGKEDVVCLWWGSAELEWLLSKDDAALEVVLRSAGQEGGRTGVHILRAKRRLEELCQPDSTSEWRFRLRWMKLRILLELLVGTLDSAVAVVTQFLAYQANGSLQHESLTVARLLMLYHHTVTLHNPAPPAILRDRVQEALGVYPSNSIVVGLFLECEKGEGVWGRVRGLLSESVPGTLQEKSVGRRLIEVWIAKWEEGRWLGEVERTRAGLEAAIKSDRTKGSAILWKVYVKFEIAAGNLKRAKAVLFRALKECPLVKELYLLAFEEDLRQAYTRRELMDLSDTMAERGIRLRRSLGEVLEMHADDADDKAASGSEDSVGEDEDEQEYESRELRRLMPY
ncbi:DUF1740-domain-containing protein [Fomitiporia mediterranea MF3/22]|uniref:DUF1740-domain-containing protein n=1 Tax=Fomitiporia mediterranea (strain MF3/22) TaxID=694068 RepID=UPI0004407F7A|nr:DUF1740-domain-containing protein [Fomitiporia mediterranea MF3/22]EJD04053.1 DUF1740-domain-containing protein [Fomitiporia mediterranea MF3/22]